MDSEELDLAIHELETRVERLRSLYEQYFLGIEKIEPGVARKDVDRRIWQLKRAKIRNTAKRFKLQTIIQRYNTFQQYWQRICREIERGTYRRHVLRAERATITVSDLVAKREQERAEQGTTGSDFPDAGAQLADLLARDVDAEQEFARALAEANQARGVRAQADRRERLGALDLELEGLDSTRDDTVPELPPPRRGNLLAALGNRPASGANPAPRPLAGPRPGGQRLRQQEPAPPSAGSAPKPIDPAPSPTPARAAGGAPAAETLSDQRISELHRQLVAAKHRTKETGKVSVQGLAKSLRAAESKLREQHKNRRIDFDVVIKNGKAVVKPIVR